MAAAVTHALSRIRSQSFFHTISMGQLRNCTLIRCAKGCQTNFDLGVFRRPIVVRCLQRCSLNRAFCRDTCLRRLVANSLTALMYVNNPELPTPLP